MVGETVTVEIKNGEDHEYNSKINNKNDIAGTTLV